VEKHREGIMKSIDGCTVKNSIEIKPEVKFILK